MNPYDFVPIDTEHLPARHKPVWHNTLTSATHHTLYSGSLELDIEAETPLFILDPSTKTNDPLKPATHIRNKQGYIIPGSSLKGMLRCIAETVGNGCFTLFDATYRDYVDYSSRLPTGPTGFSRCTSNTSLCISCRIFGMMQPGQRSADMFLGKVNISDAQIKEDAKTKEKKVYIYKPSIYTAVLDSPKPRHRAFYLDKTGATIAGRKYYFHRDSRKYPITADRLIPIPRNPNTYRNQHIQPLDYGTTFFTRIDFTNLEAEEFALLILSVTLQKDMRHKIGYAKPLGLGSIMLIPTGLKLVDYTKRYTAFDGKHGISTYDYYDLQDLLEEKMASIGDGQVTTWLEHFSSQKAMDHLHRIWLWPPDPSVEYCYPSQTWFRNHSTARIPDTADLFPGD